jgi:glycosyltransferase involved in cell wall biosynthesis
VSAPPLVSVIVPVYNGERYLGAALTSALGQTYVSLEVIVVDDGSTDGTGDVARRYPVRYVRQVNQGTGAARNTGLAAARGDFIGHLDADDLWEPDKTRLQVAALAADPGLDAVSGHVVEFHSPDLPDEARRRLRPPRSSVPGHVHQAMTIRREAHARVGQFETHWTIGQDMSWFMRAREIGFRFSVLPDIVLRRRLHAASKGVTLAEHAHQRLLIVKAALDRRRRTQ